MRDFFFLIVLLPTLINAIQLLSNQLKLPTYNLIREDSTVKNTGQVKVMPQIEDICGKDVHVIENSNGLRDLINKCQEISGSIKITNSYLEPTIELEDLKKVKGDLKISDSSKVTTITGNNLQSIGGEFNVKNLTTLVSIEMRSLKFLDEVNWEILPLLNSITLNDNLKRINRLVISDTALANINCFHNLLEVGTFDINNNRFLEVINSKVNRVGNKLNIYANSKDLSLDMKNLQSVGEMSIRDTKYVDFSNLEYVNKSLDIIENSMSNVKFQNLKKVEGTVGIMDNPHLTKVDMENVKLVDGGLLIVNNSQLDTIDFMPNLKTIGGAIHIEGSFNETNFKSLKLVKGSATIISQSDEFDCDKWVKPVNGRSIIRGGKIKCSSNKNEKFLDITEDGKIDKSENDRSRTYEKSENDKDQISSLTSKAGKLESVKETGTLTSSKNEKTHIPAASLKQMSVGSHIQLLPGKLIVGLMLIVIISLVIQ